MRCARAVPAALRRSCASAAGSSCSAITRWRTASSSRASRHWRPTTLPPGLPVLLADRGPQLRLLVRGSERRVRDRDRGQPARRLGAAARRRAGQGAGMTVPAAHGPPAAPKHAPRCAVRRCLRPSDSGLIVGGMCALLGLNTASAANELARHDLAVKDAAIAAQVQQLQNEVAASAAPASARQRCRRARHGSRPATRRSSRSARTAGCGCSAARRPPPPRRPRRSRAQAEAETDVDRREDSAPRHQPRTGTTTATAGATKSARHRSPTRRRRPPRLRRRRLPGGAR